MCKSYNSSKLNKKNSIAKHYSFNEEEPQVKLKINGQEKSAFLVMVDTTTWIEDTQRTASLSTTEGNVSVSKKVFNKDGLLMASEELFGSESAAMLNEKQIPRYDSKGRLVGLRLIKEALNVDNEYMTITYDEDELFPKEIRAEVMMEIFVKRENEGNGYKYILTTVVPQELMDEVKKELGPNATAEEIKEALGPFGQSMKEYSTITKLPNGHYEDKNYKENDKGKVEMVSRNVFTKDFVLMERETFLSDNTLLEKYSYDAQGKKLKVERKDNTPLTFDYDANGNLVKESTENGYVIYTYNGSDVLSQATYMFDEMVEYVTYEYK